MRIERIKKHKLPKWMRKYPRLARLFGVGYLFTMPFIVPVVALWEFRIEALEAFHQATALAFLPWEVNK